jgi:multidrug resistance efflux pump
MRGKWLLVAGVTTIAAVGAGVLSHKLRKPAAPVQAVAPATAVLSRNEITVSGTIRATHVTAVGSTIEGNIEGFLADVGDEVFEGQVLARIGAGNLEANREQAASGVELAQQQVTNAETTLNGARMEASRADADMERARLQVERTQKVFERQTTLNRAGATPKLKYEAAVAEYEAAVKEFEIMDKAARAARDGVKTAEDRLAKAKTSLEERSGALEDAQGAFEAAEVRSPVGGVIVGRHGEPGKPSRDYGEQLFQIATDLFQLEVVADPRADDLKRIYPGQKALVLVLDLQSAGMEGTVKEIKDGQAIVEFSSSTPAIKPGMRADVRLRFD